MDPLTANPNAKNTHLTSEFDKNELSRLLNLLQILSLVTIVPAIVGFITLSVIALFVHNLIVLAGPLASVILIPFLLISNRLGKQGNLRIGSWLLVSATWLTVTVYCWQLGTQVPVIVALLMPVAMSLVLMSTLESVVVTICTSLFGCIMYLFQNTLNIYNPPIQLTPQIQAIPGFAITGLIIPIIVALILIPARSQVRAMKQQNLSLQVALNELNAHQHTSQKFSQQVQSMSIQLNNSANQQAQGSQQQVSTVDQVNSFVSELSETASHIDDLVNQVSQAVEKVDYSSALIEQTVNQANLQSESGLTAVNQTMNVSDEVAELYQKLLVTMSDLKAKNAKMRVILDLLGQLSNQTHLLSLNAAIEAAGAGTHGERFGVVAEEVRNLALQSTNAGKSILSIIEEIEVATLHTVEEVEKGYQKTLEMKATTDFTGSIIAEMRAIADTSQEQTNSIKKEVAQVKQLTYVIRSATIQQRSSNQQVLNAVNELRQVAQQNAQGSSTTSVMANNLEHLSSSLKEMLSVSVKNSTSLAH